VSHICACFVDTVVCLVQPLGLHWDLLSLSGPVHIPVSRTAPVQPSLIECESEIEKFSFTKIQTWKGPWEVTCSYHLIERHPIPGECLSDLLFRITSNRDSAVSVFQWLAVRAAGNFFLSFKIQNNILYFSW